MTHAIELGLIGRGIQRSLSPRMHEGEAAAQGLDLAYHLYDFAMPDYADVALETLLDRLQQAGCAGVNVTYPFKQAVMPLLDELSENAARVGAVNTVAFKDGRRLGFNTDVTGFATSIRDGLPQARLDRVVQMGAGGAGAATAHALLGMGAGQLILFEKDAVRADSLRTALASTYGPKRVAVGDDLATALADADGLVNATPVGMAALPGSAVRRELLDPRLWVADIVYFPLETELLRDARIMGCATLNGAGMAIHQAARAFAIFTGRPADADRMRRIFAGTG